MTTATLTRTHRPARRLVTGELPVTLADAFDHAMVVAHRRMADQHLAAGLRDSRRILNEALAQCVQLEEFLEIRAQFMLDAALTPGLTEADILVECQVLLHAGAHELLTPAAARQLCVALLEGWCHRQRLNARRAA